MEEKIINKIADSGLEQIELDNYLPKVEVVSYDIAQNLFEGLILREKDFREFIRVHDWSQYAGKIVALYCSADAIVPSWAYMLFASRLEEAGSGFHFGSLTEVNERIILENLMRIDLEKYRDKRVLVKGCSLENASPAIYLEVTRRLQPVVKSLMFGEACSTVPVYKRK